MTLHRTDRTARSFSVILANPNERENIMVRTSLLIVAILFVFTCFTGCGSAGNVDTATSLPTYSIISDDEFGVGKIKREVAVRLEGKATESELTAIANVIKKKKSKSYERTNVHYYLPGMKQGEGAWATADFNPDLKVVIFGSTE
jgi:hypothetical protein